MLWADQTNTDIMRIVMKCLRYFFTLLLVLEVASQKTISFCVAKRDNEQEKRSFANNAGQARIPGLQGCKNKKQCGNYGSYLQTYSPEGLCAQCEFKTFPERYAACPFCRAPMNICGAKNFSVCCFCCVSGIQRMLVDVLKINDDWKHIDALQTGVFSYLYESEHAVWRTYISTLGVYPKVFKYTCPGLYRGAIRLENGNVCHVWSKHISIDPDDRKLVVTPDLGKELIRVIFSKYNIFGPETGIEISKEDVSVDSIMYEEVVVRE